MRARTCARDPDGHRTEQERRRSCEGPSNLRGSESRRLRVRSNVDFRSRLPRDRYGGKLVCRGQVHALAGLDAWSWWPPEPFARLPTATGQTLPAPMGAIWKGTRPRKALWALLASWSHCPTLRVLSRLVMPFRSRTRPRRVAAAVLFFFSFAPQTLLPARVWPAFPSRAALRPRPLRRRRPGAHSSGLGRARARGCCGENFETAERASARLLSF